MKTISVIIVSWNAREYLRGCLCSIRDCGGSDVSEVIVVDNASADGSPEMVAEQFPEVILIQANKNLGFAAANNLGIQRATGAFVAFINSDVIVHPGCFGKLRAFFESHRDAGLIGPRIIGADGRVQSTCRRLPTLWNTFYRSIALDALISKWRRTEANSEEGTEVEALTGCFWLARREAIMEVGALDERFFFYAEDLDWCRRYGDAGWKVMFVPAATATHFGGGSSANAPDRYSIEMLRANLIYWTKYNGVAGKIIFYFTAIIHHAIRIVIRGAKTAIRREKDGESVKKLNRSLLCIRWLIFGNRSSQD